MCIQGYGIITSLLPTYQYVEYTNFVEIIYMTIKVYYVTKHSQNEWYVCYKFL